MASHSKLSPSASERWSNCPISVHLSEGFEDSRSVYAAEGTLAHKLAELKLIQELTDEEVTEEEFSRVRANKLYDPEMEEYTDDYVERIRAVYNTLEIPFLAPETRLDLTEVIGEESFGTADCIICSPGEIHVFDFKYGKNVEVEAENNSQMRLYALGAVNLFESIYGIDNVHTHIIQPRMNNFSSENLSLSDLTDWLESVIKPAAHAALNAEGQPHKGEWCTFCLAKPICRAYGSAYEEPPGRDLPPTISNQEVAYRIAQLEGIDTYLKELKEYALSTILKGGEIPGFKLVEGRSNRVWTNQEEAFNKAEAAGYDRSILFEQKPLSLSKIEKLIGKKKFSEILGEFVNKPQGKPTLVKDSDKRAPYKKTSAKDDFKDIEID